MTIPIDKDELLDYYIHLDNNGKVIHPFLLKNYTTGSKLLECIINKKLDDFSFEKTKDTQERSIEAYNYEKNYQRYAKFLANVYKGYTGNNPKKCYRNITEEEFNDNKKEKERRLNEEERNALNSKTEYDEIETEEDNIANKNIISLRSMYPLKFKCKYTNKTIDIVEIAKEYIAKNPETEWYKFDKQGDEYVECECGKVIRRSGLKKHQKRSIHFKMLKNKRMSV